MNPVTGAVGLLWSGNWHVCQSAVKTVLQGGSLQPLPEFSGGISFPDFEEVSECGGKRKRFGVEVEKYGEIDFGLCLNIEDAEKRRRWASPISEESDTTTLRSDSSRDVGSEVKLLRLFV